jgi:hypothetical protein
MGRLLFSLAVLFILLSVIQSVSLSACVFVSTEIIPVSALNTVLVNMPRPCKTFSERSDEKGDDTVPRCVNGDQKLKRLQPQTEAYHQKKLDGWFLLVVPDMP